MLDFATVRNGNERQRSRAETDIVTRTAVHRARSETRIASNPDHTKGVCDC